MKKIITALLLITSTIVSYGQVTVLNIPKSVEVGKVKSGLYTHAELSYSVEDKDTIYSFRYLDAQYKVLTEYKTIYFSSMDNSLEAFYKICKSVFSEDNKKNKDYSVDFKLDKNYMFVKNTRMFGIPYITIAVIDKGYTIQLLESQIDKLFGKK